jgi:hypothetical protein
MNFTKASDLKKHIGQIVEWRYAHDRHRGTCLIRRGRLERIEGRNVVVDGEYYWFTDIKRTLALANAPYQPHGGNEAAPPDQPTK